MIFLNSASSASALVFYLPGVCTHTDTEGKQRKARVRNILEKSEKNTIFNEHPVLGSLSKQKDTQINTEILLNSSLLGVKKCRAFSFTVRIKMVLLSSCRGYASTRHFFFLFQYLVSTLHAATYLKQIINPLLLVYVEFFSN